MTDLYTVAASFLCNKNNILLIILLIVPGAAESVPTTETLRATGVKHNRTDDIDIKLTKRPKTKKSTVAHKPSSGTNNAVKPQKRSKEAAEVWCRQTFPYGINKEKLKVQLQIFSTLQLQKICRNLNVKPLNGRIGYMQAIADYGKSNLSAPVGSPESKCSKRSQTPVRRPPSRSQTPMRALFADIGPPPQKPKMDSPNSKMRRARGSSNRIHYNSLTLDALKQLCKEQELGTSSDKQKMMKLLIENAKQCPELQQKHKEEEELQIAKRRENNKRYAEEQQAYEQRQIQQAEEQKRMQRPPKQKRMQQAPKPKPAQKRKLQQTNKRLKQKPKPKGASVESDDEDAYEVESVRHPLLMPVI